MRYFDRNNQSGVALVQVLVMSVLLLTLSAGLMQVIFGTHVMVARAKASDENKLWVEACFAQKNAEWVGISCAGAGTDECDYAPAGPKVTIDCSASPKITVNVEWGNK